MGTLHAVSASQVGTAGGFAASFTVNPRSSGTLYTVKLALGFAMCRAMNVLLGLLLFLSSFPASAQLTTGTMQVVWNAGSPDCQKNPQPPLQVHAFNSRVFILRENPCLTYEAPFIYLLVGTSRALLIDTGAVADAAQMPLAQTVRSLLPGGQAGSFPLLIVHTHGHLDHRSGDVQFKDTASVEILGTSLADILRQFNFSDWPNGTAHIDLGDRTVDVLPTPGHYVSELSYYDRETGLFFSGDFFLPGRLLIEDKDADLASANRITQFIADRPVTYVLGGHVELDQAGNTFLGDHYHPNERPLQLTRQDLLALPQIVASFNGFYGQHGVYVLENQNRVLAVLGGVVILLLIGLGFGIRALFRLRRRRRAAA